jgi:putative N6-adenine-specific DNA methylase
MNRPYFATIARGLEEVAARELETLGAGEIRTVFTGVHFTGDTALLYRVNLWSRVLFRVLVPVAEVACGDAGELYREIRRLDWEAYLDPGQTLAVHCTGKNRELDHTGHTALTVKNAIVDRQREREGKRSSVAREEPDIAIVVHIDGDRCSVSLDSSGRSLHRRGDHPAMGRAPLKESLAAAIVALSGWTDELPLLDPFCGSGTLPIEAARAALGIAPGLSRPEFGFQKWRDYRPELWKELVKEALSRQKSSPRATIHGSDADGEALRRAIDNARLSRVENCIRFRHEGIEGLEPPGERGVLIANPPYGKRLGNASELGATYRTLGDVLKRRFKGWTAYILSGNKELTQQIGLRSSRRVPLFNGPLPCTLLKYELY